MRTFSAQTTGLTTSDQIKYMSTQRQVQNNLAKSGGATVPQFRVAGPSTGTSVNTNIVNMANHQMKNDANSQFNSCVGQSAASCSGTLKGGRYRRKSRRYKRSRKYKLKY